MGGSIFSIFSMEGPNAFNSLREMEFENLNKPFVWHISIKLGCGGRPKMSKSSAVRLRISHCQVHTLRDFWQRFFWKSFDCLFIR